MLHPDKTHTPKEEQKLYEVVFKEKKNKNM